MNFLAQALEKLWKSVSNNFPGFEKSAPTSRPVTRSKNPVSAWDMDLSPFHRLVENQITSTRQLNDLFSHKLEELVILLREDKRQFEKKIQSFQEKLLQNQKIQTKDNAVLQTGISDILEQLNKGQQNFHEVLDKLFVLLENIRKNTYDVLRPVTAQENLLREGFTPSQILQPIEKLILLEEQSLQDFTIFLDRWQNCNHEENIYRNELREKISDWEKKIDNIDKLLLSLGVKLQNHVPGKDFFSEQIQVLVEGQKQTNEQIAKLNETLESRSQEFEKFTSIMKKFSENHAAFLKQQEKLFNEKEEIPNGRENIAFWIFVIAAMVLYILTFILK